MVKRPCLTCGTPTYTTYCEQHGGDGRGLRALRNGLNKAHWRKLRYRVLTRDGWLCRLQLPRCTKVATTVHLDPVLGGNHDIATEDDCLSACRTCHGTVDGGRASR